MPSSIAKANQPSAAPAAGTRPAAPAALLESEALAIATEAYVFAYPAVLMELTRRFGIGRPQAAPMNRFSHRDAFPDDRFAAVVRPNVDTLYSQLWFDVSSEPLMITVPDSGGRYYLLQMLDAWSDTFAVPGSRTTGNGAQQIVLASAQWAGDVPETALLVRSPTATGWIIGRTRADGPADLPAVHRFQSGLTATALSAWETGSTVAAPTTPVCPSWDLSTPPVQAVRQLGAKAFFELFAQLMQRNSPHANDCSILHRMARLGLVPGRAFSFDAAPLRTRGVLEAAIEPALALVESNLRSASVRRNGWRIPLSAIGTYGTDYRSRAMVAYVGLGANPVEDAVYPSAFADAQGEPFDSDARYTLHFAKDQLPPVRAFWSLTMYDERQLFAANDLGRYAIGDRDALRFNEDGSLDIHIQRDAPAADRVSNWLPAPASGPFSMNLRLYWPTAQVLEDRWAPPPVTRLAD